MIQKTIALDYADDQERIRLLKLSLPIHFHVEYLIILTLDEFLQFVGLRFPSLDHALGHRCCRHFDDIETLLYMKLTRFAVGKTVIIIDTIGNITVLLCLKNCNSTLDCMHGTRINLDEITFLYRDFTDQLTPASVVYHVFQFFVCLCIVSDNKLGIRLTVKDIPALHLAK